MAMFQLKTKKGNLLDVFDYAGEDPPSSQDELRIKISQYLRPTNQRSKPDKSYNCHGLTFVARTGHLGSGTEEVDVIQEDGSITKELKPANYTLAQREIETILNDNGFKRKAYKPNLEMDRFQRSENISKGDIVTYWDVLDNKKFITHTGIIFDVRRGIADTVNIFVLSKMSVDQGEFFHSIYNPYILKEYGRIAEIWSDAK